MHFGDGLPGFGQHSHKRKTITTYYRFGTPSKNRPLVLRRSFDGAGPSYIELCEEFRHFHNLAGDLRRGVLLDFDSSGYEIEVAKIANSRVDIQLQYLKQFQAATGLFLAIYFESVRYSKIALSGVPTEKCDVTHSDKLSYYHFGVRECDFQAGMTTFSRLIGKILIPPPAKKKSGKWPFNAERQEGEVRFIIGTDENGAPVEHPANPEKLSNNFGSNPGAPHYLKAVYFRKQVLSKYYDDPDRYTVSDGYLSCLGLWGVQIDNNHPSHVVVFLGDLGRDLPYSERLHWRQFNVAPVGGISPSNFKRSFLAQFAPPDAPDLIFRSEYDRLNREWHKAHQWSLFLPLRKGDEHLLATVRVPVTNSQSEFDEQVLTLTKVLVDSINEQELSKRAKSAAGGDRGITKLEKFLSETGFPQTGTIVEFLKALQFLRSSGSGHRKGSNYEKALVRLSIDLNRKPDGMGKLLREATAVLKALGSHYCPGYGSGGL